MKFQQVRNAGSIIVECIAGITDVRDAMALAYACSDAGTELLLINAVALPPAFHTLFPDPAFQ